MQVSCRDSSLGKLEIVRSVCVSLVQHIRGAHGSAMQAYLPMMHLAKSLVFKSNEVIPAHLLYFCFPPRLPHSWLPNSPGPLRVPGHQQTAAGVSRVTRIGSRDSDDVPAQDF